MMPKKDRILHCPFTILIDSAETHPFSFQKIKSDAKDDGRFFHVETRRASLGRYPNSLGDYTIEGEAGRIAVERKSVEDLQGTILGWPSKSDEERGKVGRRQRFESELENLNQVDFAMVVVEGSLADCIRSMPSYGQKPRETNAKILQRSLVAYRQDYPRVQWVFWDTRRLAEIETFRYFHRYWRKVMHGRDKTVSE